MSKAAARRILETVVRHMGEQDTVLAEIEGLCSDEEFCAYKLMIGHSMGAIVLDVINPIVAKFPDLKPPQMD